MNLPFPAQRLVHQIDMFNYPGIHRGHFTRVMATKDVVEIIQRRKIVTPVLVAIANPQPFVGMHVIKRELTFRESSNLRTRMRSSPEPPAEEEQPSHRGF